MKYWHLVPVLLVLLSGMLFSYDLTLAESDLARMMTGLVYGEASGLGIHAGLHYGLSFSFGYYHLLYALAPDGFLLNPDQAARLINALGLLSGTLMALSCSLLLGKLLQKPVAIAVTLSFLGSPMMLPFNISGHPMSAATALFFFAAWLILLARERTRWARSLLLSCALLILTVGMTLRAEIALAFPFILVMVCVKTPPNSLNRLRWFMLISVIASLAFLMFMALQRAYVIREGGGIHVLADFLGSFFNPRRIGQGIIVFALGLGLVTSVSLAGYVLMQRFNWSVSRSYVLLAGTVALPSLLFWLPNPFPARHFLFAILGAYLFLAGLAEKMLTTTSRAFLMGMLCIFANQLGAELAYPILVRSYNWTDQVLIDGRRPNQTIPLGAFPLNQIANKAKEDLQRKEAIDFADTNPTRVLFVADSQEYIMSHLLARDRSLRIEQVSVGGFKSNLLQNTQRQIYLVSKYEQYPKDALADILILPEFLGWKIKEQALTRSRYDKAALPINRAYDSTGDR